jgi:Flp pilus assembly protein TadD
MSNPREAQFRKLVADHPHSPMGYFSLGKLYLDEGRCAEALQPLREAVRLAPDYAAALMALGAAYAGAGEVAHARETYESARKVALAQAHPSLADEAQERLAELEESPL